MRLITAATAAAFALLLAACASGDPKAKVPVRLDLTIRATADVNPDDQGRAAPIVVRIYELRTDGTFNAIDFFSLQANDKTLLADDLIKRDQFQLRPGERKRIRRNADPAASTLGVIAAYRDLPNSAWRAIYPMPDVPDKAWYRFSRDLKLTIDLGESAIQIIDKTNQ
ncbi:type VI secretion system lipoprotein TssJ [Burkholderia ubonensis]|uniref:Type VI secretion system-associated lipoprotein n=1 Tax=Burkholderia ubonensis TaxID=101571 RepID=A0A1R1JJ25_9BURK|nr:type VI secretion system lipoprotein TssJ [Burkholderia ubonensis]OMG75193.1 type VI secretion system-associated lipoprotein [Burkholderia ubonensis]